MIEDAGRGWRYVVPSPRPRRILELELIASLASQGVAVIAAGGGGIPMVKRADGSYAGIPAVVDKDLTSALLASELGAGTLMILTAVERVAINFGKPKQRALDKVTASDLRLQCRRPLCGRQHSPKVRRRWPHGAGGSAIIAHLDQAADARRQAAPSRSD
jgi:carbamate kinase